MNIYHWNRSHRAAFTLIEMIVVIGIVAAIVMVTVPNLLGKRNTGDLKNTATQIAALLRQAQNDSMAQKNGLSWGVHFQNTTATAPFYAFFSSSSSAYNASGIAGYYRLPNTVSYLTSTLSSGSSLDVVFSQILGSASASTSIGLYLISSSSQQSIISVASSGAVNY
jgi:prepilin-type N-terminal cleavage/methylation domain-containing protein